MKVYLNGRDDERGVLTTEHASSSYDQPVLVYNGQVAGPLDLIKHPEWNEPFFGTAQPTGDELLQRADIYVWRHIRDDWPEQAKAFCRWVEND